MATITPVSLTNAGTTITRAASAPAGDVIPFSGGGTDLLVHFENGHNASITVSFAPTQTTKLVPGVGLVNVPTRSIAIAAGDEAAFLFKSSDVEAYVNSSNQIPISYTSGNAALTVMALRV